jgi:hypothetical protein
MVRALPKARVQPQLVVKVGQLSQDDVTGAVQTATIEPGLSLAEAIRLLVAVAVGKTNIVDLGGGNATVEFRDSNDSKNRVVATMAGSERTNVTLDKT